MKIYTMKIKKKIEKDVICIGIDSVDTRFGEMNTYKFYCKEDDTLFRYSGTKKYDIKEYEELRVKGTIKHHFNDWESHEETKILRMKIIK